MDGGRGKRLSAACGSSRDFEPRFAVGRRGEDHRVADRRRPWVAVGSDCGSASGAGRLRLIEPVGVGSGTPDKRRRAALQRRLPAHDLLELLLELLLVEQLPAGDAVDLGAQFGDAVLVGELLLLLARDQPRQHVVVEGEIGAGRKRPAGHDHEAADRDPEGDRAEPDLAAGMAQRVVGLALGAGAWLGPMGCACAW